MKSSIMKFLLVTFVLLPMASSQAGDEVDDSDFQNGQSEGADNAQSETPDVFMSDISFRGNGCLPGEAIATLSPDGKALSILFDNFNIQSTDQGMSRRVIKNCQTYINFNVPSGYKAAIVKTDYRGYNFLPRGSRAKLTSIYHFSSAGMNQSRRIYKRKKVFVGPIDEEFFVTAKTNMRKKWSRCGKNFLLNIQTNLMVKTPRDLNEDLYSGIDSLDMDSGHQVKYHLTWKKCQPRKVRKERRKERGRKRRQLKRNRRSDRQ